MKTSRLEEEQLVEKIRELPPDKQAEVEDRRFRQVWICANKDPHPSLAAQRSCC
jgi:hypothetical protein